MAGVNKVILIGNVGADPESTYNADGNARATLRIACSESWKDKQSGEKKERTEWVPLVAFGKLAETIDKYVKKGDKIYVEGKYQTRKWADKEGTEKYYTEVMVSQFQFIGGKQKTEERTDAGERRSQQQYAQGQGGFDEDIPF